MTATSTAALERLFELAASRWDEELVIAPARQEVKHLQATERLAHILKDHYLTGIQCDSVKKLDWPTCQCSMVDLGWHPSIGQAVDAWVEHVLEQWTGDER